MSTYSHTLRAIVRLLGAVLNLSLVACNGGGSGDSGSQSEQVASTKPANTPASDNAEPSAMPDPGSDGGAERATPSASGTDFSGDGLIYDCNEVAFESDKKKHEVFVAWFHADWCPSCEKQRRELEPLKRAAIKGSPVICRYDYDETEDLQAKLRVQRQSSFIRFVAGAEQARSVGETGKDRLIKFLEG